MIYFTVTTVFHVIQRRIMGLLFSNELEIMFRTKLSLPNQRIISAFDLRLTKTTGHDRRYNGQDSNLEHPNRSLDCYRYAILLGEKF